MKISCVMITAHRREFVPCAVACFQAQTWPDCELIVYDNGGSSVIDLLPPDPRIKYFRRPRSLPDVSIGALRNIAIDVAQGEWIATWDDDDWSHPGRLLQQAGLAANSRADLVGYDSMYFFDATRAGGAVWRYAAEPDTYVIGTSFFFRKELWRGRPFEDRDVGEDNHFLEGLRLATVSATESPLWMVARSHDRGSHQRHLHGEQWTRLDADIDATTIQQVKGCFR